MYKIPVKIEKLQKRQRSAGLLHVLAGFFLLVTGSIVDSAGVVGATIFIGWFPLVIAFASIIYGLFRRKIDPAARLNLWMRVLQAVAFIVKAIMVFDLVSIITIISLFIWAAVCLMLVYTEMKMLRPAELNLSKEGIKVPGQFTDPLIPWSLLTGFVLRPDYITLTREDRSYTQLEITADLDAGFIQEVNAFANKQIEENETPVRHDQ